VVNYSSLQRCVVKRQVICYGHSLKYGRLQCEKSYLCFLHIPLRCVCNRDQLAHRHLQRSVPKCQFESRVDFSAWNPFNSGQTPSSDDSSSDLVLLIEDGFFAILGSMIALSRSGTHTACF